MPPFCLGDLAADYGLGTRCDPRAWTRRSDRLAASLTFPSGRSRGCDFGHPLPRKWWSLWRARYVPTSRAFEVVGGVN